MRMNETAGKFRIATERFIEVGYLKENPIDLQRMSIAVYRLLLAGNPVSNADIANATGIDEERVTELFQMIPASAYDRDDTGAINAFIGLSLTPANHAFVVDGTSFYTWCVLDALFLPELIGKKAIIKTKCPETGRNRQ